MWDSLFAKLYKLLRLERIGFGRPQTLGERLLTTYGLNIEPAINMVDLNMFHQDIVGKYNGHNGYNGGVAMNGKRKNKWSELRQSNLSVPGNIFMWGHYSNYAYIMIRNASLHSINKELKRHIKSKAVQVL